jgi:hypothetical protein
LPRKMVFERHASLRAVVAVCDHRISEFDVGRLLANSSGVGR